MAKNYSYQQPANTSSMSSSYSVYNQPQQSTNQPQQNNSQQSSYAAPQPQQQAAPLNMAAYSPQPQQAARTYSPGQAQGIEPRSNGTPMQQPAPQTPQSPANGRDAWKQAGRPGWDPNGIYSQVTGTAQDGTEFGLKSEAAAYDRWRAGSSGNAQPNPTQPPPNGRYGGPQQDRLMPAQPVAPAYDPRFGNMDQMPTTFTAPSGNTYDYTTRQAEQPRFLNTPRGAEASIEQNTYPSAAPPRPAPQPGQNSYGFRGYDIDNGYSIRPEASPANAANFGGGPKPNLFSQSFTSPDGTTSDQPNFAQRDAFLNNLLDHDSENPGGMYQGSGRAPQSFMNPRPDIMGMWNKAGSMARDGWTNPVAGLLNQAR